ncbi:hypothetical protein Hanom_Chr15g01394111 [Helianthus anomalus]
MMVRKWGDYPKIYVYLVCIYVRVRRFCPHVGRLERPEEAGEDAAAGDGGGKMGGGWVPHRDEGGRISIPSNLKRRILKKGDHNTTYET